MKKILSFLFALLVSLNVIAADKPVFTFACMSDIHNQQSMINANVSDVRLRTAFTNTLASIKATENVDLLVLGGDYTSDVTITQEQWEQVRKLMVESTRAVFPDGARTPVIYVNGNHEYEVSNFDKLPKNWNAGDFYSFPMKDDLGELAPEECFYEMAPNGASPQMQLLAAFHYVIGGFDFVVLNTGKHFFASAWDYQYSVESAQWCADKIAAIYANVPNKTVFFLSHLPFADAKGVQASKGISLSLASTGILKSEFAKHPNLICLYGHDHSSNQVESYIKSETAQRVTQYDSNGNVIATPTTTTPGATERPTEFYIQSVASNMYLGFDSYNLCTKSGENKFTVAESALVSGNVTLFGDGAPTNGNGYVHCGSSGRFSGNPDATNYSSIYLYEVNESAGVYNGTRVAWPEAGKTYAIVALSSAGGYYALSNEGYSTGSTSQRMVGVSSSNADAVTFASNNVLWRFTDANAAPVTPPAGGEEKVYYIQDQSGMYLDFSGNLNVVSDAGQGVTISATTCTTTTFTTTSSLHINVKSASQYIHCGSSGRFSANTTIGDTNPNTSLWLYKVDGTTATRVAADAITSGAKYLIVGLKNGTYYQMLNTTNGSTGNDLRMLSESLGTTLDATFTFNGNNAALWTITEKSEESTAATPSFITSFMGSMRYNSLASNASPGVDDSPIVQALLVYVYKDSVVLSMKNYGQTGYLSGAAISTTIQPTLKPFTTARTIDEPTYNVTVSAKFADNTPYDGIFTGSTAGSYGLFDTFEITASDDEYHVFDSWEIVLKNEGTEVARKSLSEFYQYVWAFNPTATTNQLKFKQAEWSYLLNQLGAKTLDVEIVANYTNYTKLNAVSTDKLFANFDNATLMVRNIAAGSRVSVYAENGALLATELVSGNEFVKGGFNVSGLYLVKVESATGEQTTLKVVK